MPIDPALSKNKVSKTTESIMKNSMSLCCQESFLQVGSAQCC